MAYGIVPTGFNKKPLSTILEEVKQDILLVDSDAIVEPETVYGQLQATFSERLYSLWNLFELLYSQRSVYHAQEAGLDDLVAINNIKRLEATYSYIFNFKVVGTPGLVIPEGFTVASSIDPDVKFITLQDYTVGPDEGDYSPENYGEVLITLRATEKGKIVAAEGTVNIAENPPFGVAFVEHTEDAAVGRNLETDVELLVRREKNIATSKGVTVSGIVKALSDLNEDESKIPLTYIDVLTNRTGTEDVRGRPPHSVECIIEQQGDTSTRDEEIAQLIWDNTAVGTNIYGELSAIEVVDMRGRTYEVSFTRPETIDIYVAISLQVSSLLTAAELIELKENIATAGNDLGVGKDVSVIGPNGLANFLNNSKIVTGTMDIGTSTPPSNSYIDISDGVDEIPQKASFSTARITIDQVAP